MIVWIICESGSGGKGRLDTTRGGLIPLGTVNTLWCTIQGVNPCLLLSQTICTTTLAYWMFYLLCVMKDQIVMIAIILQTEEYLKTKEDSTAKHILSLIEEFIKWKEKTK